MIFKLYKTLQTYISRLLRKPPVTKTSTQEMLTLLNRIKELEATNNYVLLLLEQERQINKENLRIDRENMLIKLYNATEPSSSTSQTKRKKRGRPRKNHHTKSTQVIKQQNITKDAHADSIVR